MSITTISSVAANRSRRLIISTPMAGWVMALRSARASGCPKTMPASVGRSILPPASRISGPEPVDERLVGGAAGLHHLPGHQVGVDQCGPVVDQQLGHRRLPRADPAGEPDREHPGPDQAGRRGREAVANSTMVVRSSSSVTKKSSAVMPVIPPESPRAMTL